jgi:hypothetical protein
MIERQKVSYGRLFVRHWLWVPLIPLLAGVIFSLIGWVVIAEANRLERDGVDTVATVTARDIRTETDRDGNRTTRYYVSYRFTPTSDQTVNARDSVARTTYDAAQVGQGVAVRYLPDDPGVSRLSSEGTGRGGGMIFGLVGLVLLMAGGGLGWWLLRGKLSAIRAARRGEVREAEVLDHQPTNTSVNGRTQYRFRWIDASRQEGLSTMMDYNRLPAPGTVLKVYVDPRTGRGWSELDY